MRIEEAIPGVDVRKFSDVPTYYYPVKVGAWLGMIVLGIWLTFRTQGLLKALPLALVGAMYAHGVELQHQALHYTGFRSKAVNKFVGFFLGLPMFVSFSDYQFNHLRHHRLLGTPENKEFFNYGNEGMTLWGFVPQLFMLSHYRDLVKYMINAILGRPHPEAPEATGVRIRNDYRWMALILVAVVGISFWFSTTVFIWAWLIPLMIATPIHALIELPEHVGCDSSTTDVLQNTRSIKASKFSTWFTNGNNFHVEHHWLPGVPVERLVELHEKIAPHEIHLHVTYWEFYSGFFKTLYRNGQQKNNLKKSA